LMTLLPHARCLLLGTRHLLPNLRTAMFSANAAAGSINVGFIGLGRMGKGMVQHLLRPGIELWAYDISKGAREDFKAITPRAKVAESIQELAGSSSVLISMLPNSPDVVELFQGSGGLLENTELAQGKLYIDCSTIDPSVSQAVGQAVHAKGGFFVDAPVSGGVNGAKNGTLAFMVGGSEDDFKRAEPYLRYMGGKVFHCGGIGTGGAAKLSNNLALAIEMCAVSEAMNFGVSLGLDPKTLADIMNSSSARCWSSDTYNPWPGLQAGVPASDGYKGGFPAALMRKDLELAIQAAKQKRVALPLGASAHQLYSMLSKQHEEEGNHKDFGSVLEMIQNMVVPIKS